MLGLDPLSKTTRIQNQIKNNMQNFLEAFKFENSKEKKVYLKSLEEKSQQYTNAINDGDKKMAKDFIRTEVFDVILKTNVYDPMLKVEKNYINQLINTYNQFNSGAPLEAEFSKNLLRYFE